MKLKGFITFPSPREVIGVSNTPEQMLAHAEALFPSTLEVNGGSNVLIQTLTKINSWVSVPSRGDWGF